MPEPPVWLQRLFEYTVLILAIAVSVALIIAIVKLRGY